MRLCFALLHHAPPAASTAEFLDRFPLPRALPPALAGLGHEVHVVAAAAFEETYERDGVRYHFVRSFSMQRRLHELRVGGHEAARLFPPVRAAARVATLAPDVVHIHGTQLHAATTTLLRHLEHAVPVVLQYHGGFPSPVRLLRRMQRAHFARASAALFTTRAHAEPFVRAGLTPAERVIELMETSSTFARRPREEARRKTGMHGRPVLLSAGRLEQVKDPLTVLRAFRRIHAARPEARLYLYYLTDDLLPEMERYLRRHPSCASAVSFRGRVAPGAMEAVFNSADYLLQASIREFSGCAVLEAMACGVVPVVTALPSFRAMTAEGRFGRLFTPGDAEALADAVLRFDHEALEARSLAVRAWFDEALSFEAMAGRLDAIYQDLRRPAA